MTPSHKPDSCSACLQNRAKCQLALQAGKFYTSVDRVCIWGNHSTTQVPGSGWHPDPKPYRNPHLKLYFHANLRLLYICVAKRDDKLISWNTGIRQDLIWDWYGTCIR